MTTYVIAMKSGFSFVVELISFELFVEEIKARLIPEAINYFHAAGGVMFNVSDISAVFPLSAQHIAVKKSDERPPKTYGNDR